MLTSYINELKKYQNIHFIVGCSGGVDSIALAHFLITNHFPVHLVHINYHKRGESSDLDQKCVEDFAKLNKVLLSTFDYTKKDIASSNFQEAASQFRYEKFKEISANYSKSFIALAHHNNDQLETFFMNLSRKSGVLGLASIPFLHNNVIRPFLNASKTEVIEYAQKHHLQWREDESNSENQYTRNRWRNEFIPFLKNEIPTITDSASFLISHFQTLQDETEQSVKHVVNEIKETGIIRLNSKSQFSDIQLFEIWRQLGQAATTFDSFIQLFELEKGKRCELSGEYEFATKERDHIYFSKVKSIIEIPRIKIEAVDCLPTTFFKSEIYLDPAKIIGELCLRKWKKGDAIMPIGMKGRQLVSDIIKDAKIPNHAKNSIFILCDEENIHWILGLKIGKIGIAEVDSVEILKISVIY